MAENSGVPLTAPLRKLAAVMRENAASRDDIAVMTGFVGAALAPHRAALARLELRR